MTNRFNLSQPKFLLTASCLALVVFAVLAAYQAGWWGQASWDQHITNSLVPANPTTRQALLPIYNLISKSIVVIVLGLAVYFFCLLYKSARPSLFTAIILSQIALSELLKLPFARNRPLPIEGLPTHTGTSFPSIHTTVTALVVLAICYLAITSTKINHKLKQAIVLISLIYLLLMAWSRIQLRAHFVVDIIAGLCAGFILFIAAYYLSKKLANKLPVFKDHQE